MTAQSAESSRAENSRFMKNTDFYKDLVKEHRSDKHERIEEIEGGESKTLVVVKKGSKSIKLTNEAGGIAGFVLKIRADGTDAEEVTDEEVEKVIKPVKEGGKGDNNCETFET